MDDAGIDPFERERRLEELQKRVGDRAVHAAQEQEQNRAAREASRHEAEAVRDVTLTRHNESAFMALSEEFADKANPQQAQTEPDDEIQRTNTRTLAVTAGSPGPVVS